MEMDSHNSPPHRCESDCILTVLDLYTDDVNVDWILSLFILKSTVKIPDITTICIQCHFSIIDKSY